MPFAWHRGALHSMFSGGDALRSIPVFNYDMEKLLNIIFRVVMFPLDATIWLIERIYDIPVIIELIMILSYIGIIFYKLYKTIILW